MPTYKPKRILSLCGSLSKASVNAALLDALAKNSPESICLTPYLGLQQLPFFNPDIDHPGSIPEEVVCFRQEISNADGLIIATPEYIHNMPGLLKNALEWGVSSSSFCQKPVLLILISAGDGAQTQDILTDILTLLEADLIGNVSYTKSKVKKSLGPQGQFLDHDLKIQLLQILLTFPTHEKPSNPLNLT